MKTSTLEISLNNNQLFKGCSIDKRKNIWIPEREEINNITQNIRNIIFQDKNHDRLVLTIDIPLHLNWICLIAAIEAAKYYNEIIYNDNDNVPVIIF